MLWLESHADLGGHPKTKRLSKLLGTSVPATVGHLTLLWHWALKYATDGELSKFDDDEIADAAMWEGDPYSFVSALLETGWIDESADGLVLHEWEQYGGKSLEAREKNKERQHRFRERHGTIKKQVNNAPPDQERAPVLVSSPDAVPVPVPDLVPAPPDQPLHAPITPISAPLRNGYVTVTSQVDSSYITPYITEHNITEHNSTGHDVTEHEITVNERERRDLTPRAPAPAHERGDAYTDDADRGGDPDPELAWWEHTVALRAEREALDAARLLASVDVATETELWQARENPGVWRNWMLRALGFAVRDLRAAEHMEQTNARSPDPRRTGTLGARADRPGAGPAARAPDRQDGETAAPASGPTGAAAVLAAFNDPDSSVSRALRKRAEERGLRTVPRAGPDHAPE